VSNIRKIAVFWKILLVKYRFLAFKYRRRFLNRGASKFFHLTRITRGLSNKQQQISDINSFDLKLKNLNVSGKYFWKNVPRDYEECETSIELGVNEIPLIQLFTKDGDKFVEVCMPQGYGIIYMKLLQPKYFLDNYYQSDFDGIALEKALSPEIILSERNVNKVEIYCRNFIKEKSRVLDIGCGFGDQLNFFKGMGHITKGIEPGKQRANFAIKNFQLDILNVPLESIESNSVDLGEKYDLIYLNQVLEHLKNPVKLLRCLRQHLTDEGILFIAVPNFNFEGFLVKTFTPVHTHSFTSVGLVSMSLNLGYELKKNYSDDLYNIMIFSKGEKYSQPSGDAEIRSELAYDFGLSECLKENDILEISSNTLGLWSCGMTSRGSSSLNQLPVKINTDFIEPQLLFK
jgi:2-polyprenyl-3-methyl-5-hydroxy-6-metoxy-1,4-benzoquinol methylase